MERELLKVLTTPYSKGDRRFVYLRRLTTRADSRLALADADHMGPGVCSIERAAADGSRRKVSTASRLLEITPSRFAFPHLVSPPPLRMQLDKGLGGSCNPTPVYDISWLTP